jgi:hypothetical protein
MLDSSRAKKSLHHREIRRPVTGKHYVLARYENVPDTKCKTSKWESIQCERSTEEDAEDDQEHPRIESPGQVWHFTIIEQIETAEIGYRYAIHEQMPDESWHTRIENSFPDPEGKGILVPKVKVRWPLPDQPIQYGSDEELFNEIRDFYRSNLDFREDMEYDVLAAFTLVTWRFEQFDIVAYLLFLGPKESGKSRALECLQALCYRSWLTTHPSTASLHHVMHAWHPTFLLDNYESLPRERRYEIEGILNAGYRRGGAVDRVEPLPEGGFKEKWYEVYCPKALAGNQEPSETFASRCIIFRMRKTQRSYPRTIDHEQAKRIRSKLLSYRLKHLSSREDSESEIPNAYGRFGEIFSPLVSVAPSQSVLEALLEYGNSVLRERDEEDRASFDAQVLKALVNSKEHLRESKIAVKRIAEAFNEDRPEKEKTKSWHITRCLTRLGFARVRMPDKSGSRGIRWNQPLIEDLAARYGIELPQAGMPIIPLHTASDASDRQNQAHGIEPKSDTLTDLTDSAAVLGESMTEDEDSDDGLVLNALRKVSGSMSWDYALSRAMKATGDRTKAEGYLKRFQADGRFVQDPDGYWRLLR